MIYVVGSGPAGVACAAALVDAGAEVTVLDVGRRLEHERASALARLRHAEPDAWDPDVVRELAGSPFAPGGGARALKLAYGSSFPYAGADTDLAEQRGTDCVQSFARGGLSTVWGAAVLPASAADVADWPVGHAELVPHYEAVARVLGVAAGPDDLAEPFPVYAAPRPAPPLSRQAERLAAHMARHRATLAARGYVVGRARLALRLEDDAHGRGCRRVGLCLTGCPYGAIWSADEVLGPLIASGRLHYRSGVKVETVTEERGEATVVARADDGSRQSISAERVFVAAGVPSTLAIVLRSLERYDAAVPLRYHPYFLVPALARESVDGVVEERLHTLAQLFVELREPRLSPHWIHLQLYTYNPIVKQRVESALRVLGPLAATVERRLLGRLLVVQGYLAAPSDVGIAARLRRDADGRARLELDGRLPRAVRKRIRALVWRLARDARALGLLPLIPMLHVGRPGEGNHVGACFPMRARPAGLETDRLGRLPDFRRVHLVDASVLPSLPATTLTYTAMANARRIAVDALRES